MIDKYELIEILETLQDTGDIQFKESNKVDMVDRYLKSCEGKNGVLPLVCAQHEHERTLLKALNKYVKYKFSG